MILSRRDFGRRLPDKSAKSIYIFCDGKKAEYQYFSFFKELDSSINIEVYELTGGEDNSPLGLYKIACTCLINTEDNPNPKYELLNDDEVWFVIDTDKDKLDSRKIPIETLRKHCIEKGWKVAQSNPCFEVWQHYHFDSSKPTFENLDISNNWKQFLQSTIGGFNPRKHPIHINTAISNAKNNHEEKDSIPIVCCTQVFELAEVIYPMVKTALE